MSDFRINPTGTPGSILGSTPMLRPEAATDTASFSTMLGNAIQEVNGLQAKAGEDVAKVLTGEITDIHSAMIAVQKADVSFLMMMQIRNSLVTAYQEMIKMSV